MWLDRSYLITNWCICLDFCAFRHDYSILERILGSTYLAIWKTTKAGSLLLSKSQFCVWHGSASRWVHWFFTENNSNCSFGTENRPHVLVHMEKVKESTSTRHQRSKLRVSRFFLVDYCHQNRYVKVRNVLQCLKHSLPCVLRLGTYRMRKAYRNDVIVEIVTYDLKGRSIRFQSNSLAVGHIGRLRFATMRTEK